MATDVFTKVFGIGLSRTGTLSLAKALDRLGIPTVHFPEGEETFRQLRSGDFRLAVMDHYRGACDTPVVPYFPQLDKAFPGSRFILTLRSDRHAWLDSLDKLWCSLANMQKDEYLRFVNTAVYGMWGFSRERFDWVYTNHVATVRRYFVDRPQDLLELDICAGEGWATLAPFLGRPMPTDPFPHADLLKGDKGDILGMMSAAIGHCDDGLQG
jgi:hypothetical protein